MASSIAVPSFFLSAGARLIMISAEGMVRPHCSEPVKMRFSLSRMAASGSPTMEKLGIPRFAVHSTVTSKPSAP